MHPNTPPWARELIDTVDRISWWTSRIYAKEHRQMKTIAEIQADMSATLDKVTAIKTVEDGIATFVTDIKTQNTDLQAKIDALIAAGSATPEQLQALSDTVATMNTTLDAEAVVQATILNTPAAPPAP